MRQSLTHYLIFLSGFDWVVRVQTEVLWCRPGALPQKHIAVLPELRGARPSCHRVREGGQGSYPDLSRYSWALAMWTYCRSEWSEECVVTLVCVCVAAVIPQHGVDSSLSSNNEELKPAVYYERLKILRQRQGLENTSRVSEHTDKLLANTVLLDSVHPHCTCILYMSFQQKKAKDVSRCCSDCRQIRFVSHIYNRLSALWFSSDQVL